MENHQQLSKPLPSLFQPIHILIFLIIFEQQFTLAFCLLFTSSH